MRCGHHIKNYYFLDGDQAEEDYQHITAELAEQEIIECKPENEEIPVPEKKDFRTILEKQDAKWRKGLT